MPWKSLDRCLEVHGSTKVKGSRSAPLDLCPLADCLFQVVNLSGACEGRSSLPEARPQ